tara:strand:- start:26005 stop:27351 length:1347 start_codon:yes stop_codon:yes gene_type:complete
MNKIYSLLTSFLIFFILISCSFDNKTGVWKDKSKELEMKSVGKNVKRVFSKVEKFKEEVSNDLIINISRPVINYDWIDENFSVNNLLPHFEYEDKKNLIFKSKKILKKINSDYSDFVPLISKNNIFLYDSSGSIYNYSLEKKILVWRFNFYKKKFKKFPIKINLKIESNNLIVSDNLGYFYSIDVNSGEIQWAKNYGVPFRSNIKVAGQYIFAVNQDNKFYGIRKNDGEKSLDLETFPSFLHAEQKTNISVDDVKRNVYFITSSGEVYSINYEKNIVNWIYKATTRSVDKTVDLFFSSPIIFYDDKIIISTSVSTISLNSSNGRLNWELPFSTYIRPAISNDFIFLASDDGFIINLNTKTGKVVWSKNLFNKSKKINKEKIGKITSIILISEKIFVTTKKGYFLFIDYNNGEISNYAKADSSGFFSKPIVVNKKIYIVNMKGQILIFN